jgi:lysosomal Pro-X carboxypeptidase
MCSNGKTDMFEPQDWNYESYKENCVSSFGIKPRSEWPVLFYGGSDDDLRSHSNIIFSNGDLDPWSSGGVLDTKNEKLTIIYIEQGAHHLGLIFVQI